MSLIDIAHEKGSEDFDSISVIDLSDIRSPSIEKRKALASTLRDACLTAGFFYVKNHAVPTETTDQIFQMSKSFFAQSSDIKESVDISQSDNFRGYQAILTENNDPTMKGELHEAFNIGLDPSLNLDGPQANKEGQLAHSDNQWPEKWADCDAFRQANLNYYEAVLALGQALFPLFALALNLPETFFDDKTLYPAAIMRLLHYPAMGNEKVDERTPGIGAHTDFECFTILRQEDVPGLQVQNRAGKWLDAPCIPNTFLINIGDQFARWTNDIFVSTRHRALPATSRPRYSIPFFFGCDHDVPLIPPESCISEDRPARYEVVTAGAYVHKRLMETYGYKAEGEVGLVAS